MKKFACILVCIVALTVMATHVFAEYDKDMVVNVMRANGANMGKIKKAADDGDFFTAAEALMEIAQNMKSLDAVTPKKGEKTQWDAIHGEIITSAFKGIGACGEEDKDKLMGLVGEIGALIKKGHTIFK